MPAGAIHHHCGGKSLAINAGFQGEIIIAHTAKFCAPGPIGLKQNRGRIGAAGFVQLQLMPAAGVAEQACLPRHRQAVGALGGGAHTDMGQVLQLLLGGGGLPAAIVKHMQRGLVCDPGAPARLGGHKYPGTILAHRQLASLPRPCTIGARGQGIYLPIGGQAGGCLL